jgi:hypothetical protein
LTMEYDYHQVVSEEFHRLIEDVEQQRIHPNHDVLFD